MYMSHHCLVKRFFLLQAILLPWLFWKNWKQQCNVAYARNACNKHHTSLGNPRKGSILFCLSQKLVASIFQVTLWLPKWRSLKTSKRVTRKNQVVDFSVGGSFGVLCFCEWKMFVYCWRDHFSWGCCFFLKVITFLFGSFFVVGKVRSIDELIFDVWFLWYERGG